MTPSQVHEDAGHAGQLRSSPIHIFTPIRSASGVLLSETYNDDELGQGRYTTNELGEGHRMTNELSREAT